MSKHDHNKSNVAKCLKSTDISKYLTLDGLVSTHPICDDGDKRFCNNGDSGKDEATTRTDPSEEAIASKLFGAKF